MCIVASCHQMLPDRWAQWVSILKNPKHSCKELEPVQTRYARYVYLSPVHHHRLNIMTCFLSIFVCCLFVTQSIFNFCHRMFRFFSLSLREGAGSYLVLLALPSTDTTLPTCGFSLHCNHHQTCLFLLVHYSFISTIFFVFLFTCDKTWTPAPSHAAISLCFFSGLFFIGSISPQPGSNWA